MNNTFKKRIDELGRIVIPKQIRNVLKINNFEELEIYIENKNIIIKKGIGLIYLKNKLDNLLDLLKDIYKFKIAIVENNKILSTNSEKLNEISKLDLNYDNMTNVNDFVDIKLDNNYITKVFVDSLIYDSNLLGYIVFINDDASEIKIQDLKKIKNVVIDLLS